MTAMNTPMSSTAVAMPVAPAAIARAAALWRALVSFAEAWSANRRRMADDQEALAHMSDRQLLDIGISRATAEAIVDGHRFEGPRI